jgi:hypothetical protein
MMDARKVRSAHDAGDHYIVDHVDHGMQPVFKDGLSPEDAAHLQHLAHGTTANVDVSQDPGVSEDPGMSTSSDVSQEAPLPAAAPVATTHIAPDGGITIHRYTAPAGLPLGPGLDELRAAAAKPGAIAPVPSQLSTTPEALIGLGQEGVADRERELTQEREQQSLQNQRSAMGVTTPGNAAALNQLLSGMGAPPANAVPPAPAAPTSAVPPLPVAPAAPEAPAAPAPTFEPLKPATVPGMANYSGEIGRAGKAEQGAELLAAFARGAIDNGRAKLLEEKTSIADEFSKNVLALQQKHDKAAADLRAAVMTDIDPTRRFKEAPGWSNALTLVGLFASGFGSAITKTPDEAMALFNKATDRDIDAQVRNRDRSMHLLELNEEQRRERLSEIGLLKANALDAIGSAIEANAARGAPGVALAEAQALNARIAKQTAEMRQNIAINQAKFGIERRVAEYNLRAQQQAMAQRAFEHNLVAAPLGMPQWDPNTGLPSSKSAAAATGQLSPALQAAGVPAIAVPSLVDAAIKGLGEHGVIVKEPARDTTGAPVVDPQTGKVQYDKGRMRVLQDKGARGDVLKKVSFLQTVQEPVSELTHLVRQYPEGTILDRAAIAKAESLVNRISAQLTEAQTGSTRLSDVDIGLSKQLAADLGVVNAALGKTPVRIEQLQHTLDAGWRGTDPFFYPDAWVQALHASER